MTENKIGSQFVGAHVGPAAGPKADVLFASLDCIGDPSSANIRKLADSYNRNPDMVSAQSEQYLKKMEARIVVKTATPSKPATGAGF